jgi:rhamnogalacturonan endolyase
MIKMRNILIYLMLIPWALCSCQPGGTDSGALQGFVLVSGLQYETSNNIFNTGDFEILDHPVTNQEYKHFIDATGYRAPLHWENGKIPRGKEEYPVIFVNRDDTEAYTSWLTQTTGRVHRVPTPQEFELAARGGVMNQYRYYWGDDEDLLTRGEINFNESGNRGYDQWENWLKPARWGMQNSIGLYQMAGNVWQITSSYGDPATSNWKYRVEELHDIERSVMGGSWASPEEFLDCGRTFSQSPGLRTPDLGIRLVREPDNAKWSIEKRNIVAVTHSAGKTGISWALLETDGSGVRFNIYRLTGSNRSHNGIRLNEEPLFFTSYLDEHEIIEGTRYQYRVTVVDQNGSEGNPSEWAAITAGEEEYPVVAKFKPIFQQGGMTPVFGDIEGIGKPGCVIRLDNGNREMSQDPGIPVRLEAFSYSGRSLWRKDIAWHSNIFGSANNCPFNVWDMNGNGRAEVITLLQIGNDNFLAILDGKSGKVLHTTPWDEMATDLSRSSTRIQMSIAYLDGINPSVITMTGIYENEVISAYDNELNKLWSYESFMETSGTGGHKIEIADVNNNGKHEIIYGTTCLNSDGTLRWSIFRQHPDIISVYNHIPERQGLEVLFIVESFMHAGIYMVDANTGEVIWKNNREEDPQWSHGHAGWTSDIWNGHPGSESVTNRQGHGDTDFVVFNSEGERLTGNFPPGITPIEWDGDNTRELLAQNGRVIGKFNGTGIVPVPGEMPNPVPGSSLIMVADLYGDFRGEMVISATDTDGRPAIMIVTAPSPIEKRFLAPTRKLEYNLWIARNRGGGYGSVHEYELLEAGAD